MGTQTQNVSIAVPLRYLIQLARLDQVVTREETVFSISVSAAYVWPLLLHVRRAFQVLKMVFSLSSALMSQYVDLNSLLLQYNLILNRDISVCQFTGLPLRCAFCGQDSRYFSFFVYPLLIMLPLLLLSLLSLFTIFPTLSPGSVCSQQGKCGYFDPSGNSLLACTILDVACTTLCTCNSGYGGKDCTLSNSSLTARNDLRYVLSCLSCTVLLNYFLPRQSGSHY